ncbi:MAG TPA: zf-HC2 domain-containing protein [Candidatus Binatia bacterium]|nr:zf-HC2 domain-containing protein [Candidatus Binatia bacterium]
MLGWWRPRCASIRPDLVAWVDGQLSSRRAERVRRHVDDCATCAAEAKSLAAVIESQRTGLTEQLAAVSPDIDRLWRQLSGRLHAPQADVGRRRELVWVWRPALGLAVAAALLWLGSAAFEEPAAVLISVGVKAPPAKVTQQPELFKDFAIIQDLDVLERFDTAETEPPEGDRTPPADQG